MKAQGFLVLNKKSIETYFLTLWPIYALDRDLFYSFC